MLLEKKKTEPVVNERINEELTELHQNELALLEVRLNNETEKYRVLATNRVADQEETERR